jgi:tetratricopeptide (TPR) repeat protein
LGNLLFESGRYDIVIPENRFLPFEKNAFITKELAWNEVKTLCDTFNTDAVLSIDHFKTRVITTYDKNDYFSQYENQFYEMAEATIKVSFEVVARVYDPVKEKIESRLIVRDTLVWEDNGRTINELFGRLTPIKDAISEVGIAVALEFANQVTPKWKQEKRGYFAKGDANLKQAAPLVNTSQWDTAIILWKETVENAKSKSIKSKAEFNIALGYEMLGDIDESIKWALQSYETMFRTNTYNYLETLKRRKSEINNQ